MEYLDIFTKIILLMSLGWYLITNLQWYNYKIQRVVLKHHKWQWHITYFLAPIVLFYLMPNIYYLIYFYLIYLTSFILWNRKLDRPLVLTSRVKRFLAILLFFSFFLIALCLMDDKCTQSFIFAPLLLTYIISLLLEKVFFIMFKNKAKKTYESIDNLITIAITASYGKTSIKNFLYHILKNKYKTYKTPRSVNTLTGILLDVNKDLPKNTQVYIAEAGAREKGDIEEIALFLEPQICVIGSVGEQHIEYFKSLENIKQTKKELLKSPRMQECFIHESALSKANLEEKNQNSNIVTFPSKLHIINSTLDGICFEVEIFGQVESFYAPILGSFNAINLTAVILIAYSLGMSIEDIKKALSTMPCVEHRLQKIQANGKLIIDDSFNGNLEGMLEAINICSSYGGRKVIITPGLVEASSQANISLARQINENFDFVIITGDLNSKLLSLHIDELKVLILKDKSKLQEVLTSKTKAGDLILFANDAPNFI